MREHASQANEQQQTHEKSSHAEKPGDGRTPGTFKKSSGEKLQQSRDRSQPQERRRGVSTPNALEKSVRGQQSQQQEKQSPHEEQEHNDKQTGVASPKLLEKSPREQEAQVQFEKRVDKLLEEAGWSKKDPTARMVVGNIIRIEDDATYTAHMPVKEGKPNPDYQFEHLQGKERNGAEKVQQEYRDLQYTKMGGLATTTIGSRLDEYQLLRDSAGRFSIGLDGNNQIVLTGSRENWIDLAGGDRVLDQAFEMTTEKIADKFLGEGAAQAIQIIGFAKTLSEVIRDERERPLLGGTSQEAKEWRFEKTISLLAEMRAGAIAKSEWRANAIEVNIGALSVELEKNYHDADKIVKEYTHYIGLDQQLKQHKAGMPSEGPSHPSIRPPDR